MFEVGKQYQFRMWEPGENGGKITDYAKCMILEVGLPLELAESEPERAKASVVPLERLLPEIPAVTLNDRGVWRATHGNQVGPDDVTQGSVTGDERRRRLLDGAGRLLGIAEMRSGDLLHPVLMLV